MLHAATRVSHARAAHRAVSSAVRLANCTATTQRARWAAASYTHMRCGNCGQRGFTTTADITSTDDAPLFATTADLSSKDEATTGSHHDMTTVDDIKTYEVPPAVDDSADASSQLTAAATDTTKIRFFDSREKYLVFCTTTSEKWRVGERVIKELEKLMPSPPAINIFDAGLGDAAVLTRVLRGCHGRFPTVPILTVGKEISLEDLRLALIKMPDRLAEHPQTVICVTNMSYKSAPNLLPNGQKGRENLNWIEIALKGNTAIDFERQIEDRIREIEDSGAWDVKHTAAGNPVPAKPAVLVLYREDQRFSLDSVLPRYENGAIQNPPNGYDLVVASQPFRSRATAEFKCRNVLLPLMLTLKPEGRMVVIQSTGHDPGMEIVRNAWPGEVPFATPGHVLQAELMRQLQESCSALGAPTGLRQRSVPAETSEFCFSSGDQFRYELHSLPDAATDSIGTSVLLAAWNAAVYVAQVDDARSDAVVQQGKFEACVQDVLDKHGRLWFTNEAFVVSRSGHKASRKST